MNLVIIHLSVIGLPYTTASGLIKIRECSIYLTVGLYVCCTLVFSNRRLYDPCSSQRNGGLATRNVLDNQHCVAVNLSV